MRNKVASDCVGCISAVRRSDHLQALMVVTSAVSRLLPHTPASSCIVTGLSYRCLRNQVASDCVGCIYQLPPPSPTYNVEVEVMRLCGRATKSSLRVQCRLVGQGLSALDQGGKGGNLCMMSCRRLLYSANTGIEKLLVDYGCLFRSLLSTGANIMQLCS